MKGMSGGDWGYLSSLFWFWRTRWDDSIIQGGSYPSEILSAATLKDSREGASPAFNQGRYISQHTSDPDVCRCGLIASAPDLFLQFLDLLKITLIAFSFL